MHVFAPTLLMSVVHAKSPWTTRYPWCGRVHNLPSWKFFFFMCKNSYTFHIMCAKYLWFCTAYCSDISYFALWEKCEIIRIILVCKNVVMFSTYSAKTQNFAQLLGFRYRLDLTPKIIRNDARPYSYGRVTCQTMDGSIL